MDGLDKLMMHFGERLECRPWSVRMQKITPANAYRCSGLSDRVEAAVGGECRLRDPRHSRRTRLPVPRHGPIPSL